MLEMILDNEIYVLPKDIYKSLTVFYKQHRSIILNSEYNSIMSHFEFKLSKTDELDTTDKIPKLNIKKYCINSKGFH